MRILITNDDGIQADGIRILYNELRKYHDCIVIAPNGNRSACSHSLSIQCDLYYEKSDIGYAISGTPADCVKLGVLHILKETPDLVISGINNGPNLGSDIAYSGTVSAALEASYLGVRGIAVSLSKHNAAAEYYQLAAEFVSTNLQKFVDLPINESTVLNINYPVRAPFIGYKFTKSGINLYNDTFVSGESEGGVRLKGVAVEHDRNDGDCDVELIKKGFATITPLKLDLNDYECLSKLQKFNL